MFDILTFPQYTISVPSKNSFRALPVFIILVILSVLSVTIFQSFPAQTDEESENGQVFGLEDVKLSFPVYPNAKILSQTNSENRNYFTFKSNSDITAVQQWYKTELEKKGWTKTENEYIYTKGSERLELSILDNSDKTTLIIINHIY